MTGISNARLADILYGASFNFTDNKAKALRRAGRHALSWPEEAWEIAAVGGPLTTLPAVGPWVARVILDLFESPPEDDGPPDDLRADFLTMAEARKLVDEHPEYREGLRGDLQMHSLYSDGTEPIVAMAGAAIDRGYDYIAITDHSKGLKIAGGMDESRLAAQIEEIEGANRQLEDLGSGLVILRSIELNFSTEGEVDMDAEVLQALDLCVGSFHSRLRVAQDQTERALAAVRHPEVQIIGHPQGRMFGIRKGVRGDWSAVVEEGARYNKAFEINAQPDRQDFSVPMLRMASKLPVMFSIGTDAHSIGELDNVELSLGAAIAAGIPCDRILNFLPLTELLTWVEGSREAARSHS